MTRLEQVVRYRQSRLIARVAEIVRAEFPELTVAESADAVLLAGQGLSRRRLRDARLRAIGAVLQERIA